MIKKTLYDLLGKRFCESYNIRDNDDYNIEWIDARELLVSDRIDLIAKIKYIDYFTKYDKCEFFLDLYRKHIEAFTLGTYTEDNNPKKNSFSKYIKNFNELIIEIGSNGMNANCSVIPVGKNNVILEGAHRTAISIYFNLKVPIVRFEHIVVSANAKYFERALLDDKYLDYMISEYCKWKNNVYIACVWPVAVAQGVDNINKLESELNKRCKIIYKKTILITYNGLKNLIPQIYSSHDWVGILDNHFNGSLSKVDAVYCKNKDMLVYVIEAESLQDVVKTKHNIREIFKLDENAIHICDNAEEAVQLSHMLLNNNTIDMLNKGDPFRYKNFNKKLIKLKEQLKEQLDDCVIDSSSVMSLYGIREAEDIDLLSLSYLDDIGDDHDEYIKYHTCNLYELVLNPEKHLYFNDMKFITLKVLKYFKVKRGEKKDYRDVKLIELYLRDSEFLKLYILKLKNYFHRKFRNGFFSILRKIGLYYLARDIYRFMRGKKQNER